MKLYATVIGRKNGKNVEKGQGSNQSLAIEILAEGLKGIPTRSNLYRLSLNVGNDNELEAELLDYSTGVITFLHGVIDPKKDKTVNYCAEHLKYNCEAVHYTKGEKEEAHYCPLGNHTVYGNGDVELMPDNTTPCHECLNKRKGEKQKGEICNFNACKNKAVYYGVCEKHKGVEQ